MEQICLRCQSTQVIPDALIADAAVWVPRKPGGLVAAKSARMRAQVCIACGHVETYVASKDRQKMWDSYQRRKD